jgi:hypothetical protein
MGRVKSNIRIVIDITRFGQPDDRVNKHICLTLPCSAHGELTVCAMHRVACLEGYNFAPGEFLEVLAELRRSDYTINENRPLN